MTPREIPLIRNFELTSYCNLNCPICVEKTWQRNHISLKLLETILSKNRDVFEGQSVWLHYRGEPLLYPQLEVALEMFEQFNVRTRLSTNGLLLTPQKIDMLLRSPLEGLVVSVITDDAVKYKELRGADKYTIVNDNVANLIAAHKECGSNMKIQVMALDYGQGVDKIKAFVRHYNGLGIEVSIHQYSDRVTQSRYHPEKEKSNTFKRLPCKWIFNDMVILCDGSVTTCYYDLSSRLIMGNLEDYDYSILAFWDSEAYRKIRAEHESLSFEGACKECSDWIFEHPDIDKEKNTYVRLYTTQHD